MRSIKFKNGSMIETIETECGKRSTRSNRREEKFMLSDGMGTFIYVKECEDDEDFITIEMEEEDEFNVYTSRYIDLHKTDIILLIEKLNELINR